MARAKSRLQIVVEYYPLRFLYATLALLPWPVGFAIARAVLAGILAFLPHRRRLMLENLALSFPDHDAQACRRIADQSLDNLARGITLLPRIPGMARSGFKDSVIWDGRNHIEEALQKGRGVLLLTAHYGCWEMTGAVVPTLFSSGGMVVRPLDNPYLEALMTRVRSSGGGIVVPRREILRKGLPILRRNGALGILMDQNFAGGGVFVPYFGRLAATSTVLSLLARRTGAPVIPMHSVWEGRRVRIIFEPAVPLSGAADLRQAQAEDVFAMTAVIERWVREDPGLWFWLHNRWKRQPQPGEYIFSPKKNDDIRWIFSSESKQSVLRNNESPRPAKTPGGR